MPADQDETRLRAVQKTLGEPFYGDVTPEVGKTRFRLLVVSFISIVIVSADLRIGEGSTLLGLHISNLRDAVVRHSLFLAAAYLLAHFLWISWDSFLEWRLRLSGTRVAFITGATWVSEHSDYPSDPRQSTLYSWWYQAGGSFANLQNRVDELKRARDAWSKEFNNLKANPAFQPSVHGELGGRLETILQALNNVGNSVAETRAVLSRDRIPVSLGRFDNWFRLLLRSQSLRWLFFDLLVPLFVGAVALVLLSRGTWPWMKSILHCFS